MSTPLLISLLAILFACDPNFVDEPLAMKTLVEIAARHGVPMPPKDAPLVLAHSNNRVLLTTSRDPAIYSPAFLLELSADGRVAVVLRGMKYETLDKPRDWE